MSVTVIQASGLSKRYARGTTESNALLRDKLARILRAPWKAWSGQKRETFWALKDVSLDVQEGEVLGLIGRNGSGKTTLLKILSRITRPTDGWAEIHGRMGSLLEVGTGFHAELTGRENTFLSGAILGMSKGEIERKFDEIVSFAELETFIDTPVKHYSSGMYVRLAFAVAAHLEPEILLVDEVLAVGDIKFQRKCLGKMGDVARAGRTVILVSHQLNQIRRLCNRAVWLDGGTLRETGPTAEVIGAYEREMSSTDVLIEKGPLGGKAHFLKWWILDQEGKPKHVFSDDGELRLQFLLKVNQAVYGLYHDIELYDQNRQLLWGNAIGNVTLDPGVYVCNHTLPHLPLRPGSYTWRATLWDGGENVADYDCVPEMQVATVPVGHPLDEKAGILNIPSECVIVPQSAADFPK